MFKLYVNFFKISKLKPDLKEKRIKHLKLALNFKT